MSQVSFTFFLLLKKHSEKKRHPRFKPLNFAKANSGGTSFPLDIFLGGPACLLSLIIIVYLQADFNLLGEGTFREHSLHLWYHRRVQHATLGADNVRLLSDSWNDGKVLRKVFSDNPADSLVRWYVVVWTREDKKENSILCWPLFCIKCYMFKELLHSPSLSHSLPHPCLPPPSLPPSLLPLKEL